MTRIVHHRMIGSLAALALGMAGISATAAEDAAAAEQKPAKNSPFKSLSAFRRSILQSLKPSINFAASDTYLSAQDYYGQANDQRARGVACPAIPAVIDSLAQRVGKLGFARDYDRPNTDLDREDCATYLRSTPVADYCKANACAGINQRQKRQVTDVVRYCVYLDPRQTKCDVTVISFGARWLVDKDAQFKSELRDSNRDRLISETLKPVKETIQALSAPQ